MNQGLFRRPGAQLGLLCHWSTTADRPSLVDEAHFEFLTKDFLKELMKNH